MVDEAGVGEVDEADAAGLLFFAWQTRDQRRWLNVVRVVLVRAKVFRPLAVVVLVDAQMGYGVVQASGHRVDVASGVFPLDAQVHIFCPLGCGQGVDLVDLVYLLAVD